MKKERSVIHYLALITTVTALSLSLFGLIFQNIYTARINRITEYELMGQDIVTVIISCSLHLHHPIQRLQKDKDQNYLAGLYFVLVLYLRLF